MKPLVIDLFCGLGGWTKGFLAEGYDAVGFDNHRHQYGDKHYPGQLVIQDVLTLHGSQFREAACIVASPPCQKYSWMAMPWDLAKREGRWWRWARESPFGDFRLNDLFDACFRLQREASEAAGHHIPLVVENVKGAQPWVGMAKAHFGSYYLWGDVDSVGGRIVAGGLRFGGLLRAAAGHRKNGGGSWFDVAHNTESGHGQNPVNGFKTVGHANIRDGFTHTRRLTNQAESDGVKQAGLSGEAWFNEGAAAVSSGSNARKAKSAEIAEIPPDLAQWIAQCFKPEGSPRRKQATGISLKLGDTYETNTHHPPLLGRS